MSTMLADPVEVITDVGFASVRAWKERNPGHKAIAYFPVYAPAEIIHAAGMLPVALHGAGDQLDIQYADARFGSFICSIAKTTTELALTGRLDPFDGFLFSSICDTARNVCFVTKRNLPDLWVDFLHLPHNPSSDAGVEFLSSEYRRLAGDLESLGGHPFSREALIDSIKLFNWNRELTRRLRKARCEAPHLMASSELYSIVRAGNLLPVEEHNSMLEGAIEDFSKRTGKARDSIRVVVEGSFCEQPPMDLLTMIEQAGCYVVDDDYTLGRQWFHHDVPVDGDPIESLARSYLDDSVYSSVRHDARHPRSEGLVRKVREARAEAVIMLIAKFCEPALFDYVLFKQELEKEAIPHLLIEFEEKMFTFDRLQIEVETFVESMLFE